MNRKIEKILISHKEGKILTRKAVNKILLLSIISKNKIKVCPFCNECVLINGICPKCTVEFCSPPYKPIDL